MALKLDRLATATVSEVIANPSYYGMPTPQQFKAWKDKIKRKDRSFASADKGSSLLSSYVRRQIYFIEGPDGVAYECKSLEKLEETARSMGLDPWKLEMVPELIPDAGLKCDLKITFREKKEKSKLILPGGY